MVSCKTCVYRGEQVVDLTPPVWLCMCNPPAPGGYLNHEQRLKNIGVTPYPIVDEQCWCGQHQDFEVVWTAPRL